MYRFYWLGFASQLAPLGATILAKEFGSDHGRRRLSLSRLRFYGIYDTISF